MQVLLLVDPASLPRSLVEQLVRGGAARLTVPEDCDDAPSPAPPPASWLSTSGSSASAPGGPGPSVHLGRLGLDSSQHRAYWEGRDLRVTEQEFRFLHALASDPAHALSFEALHGLVWGDRRRPGDTDRVRSAVKRLRGKLRRAGCDSLIESLRGHGFRLVG